jgi:hypothetical protein
MNQSTAPTPHKNQVLVFGEVSVKEGTEAVPGKEQVR